MRTQRLFDGVNAAVPTAFNTDGCANSKLTAAYCRYLLEHGCTGLALLGTTGEANSIGIQSRKRLLTEIVEAGIPVSSLLPGTGMPSIEDSIAITTHAAELGCSGALILPPFYYKNPSEEGVVDFYRKVVDGTKGKIKIFLYHFPQQSAIGITRSMIRRLLDEYPGVVCGIKDSEGNLSKTKEFIDSFKDDAFSVFTGDDKNILTVLDAGGAGSITATTNITSELAATISGNASREEKVVAQQTLARIREAIGNYPTIPAIKALVAARTGIPEWAQTLAPITQFAEADTRILLSKLTEAGLSSM